MKNSLQYPYFSYKINKIYDPVLFPAVVSNYILWRLNKNIYKLDRSRMKMRWGEDAFHSKEWFGGPLKGWCKLVSFIEFLSHKTKVFMPFLLKIVCNRPNILYLKPFFYSKSLNTNFNENNIINIWHNLNFNIVKHFQI